MSLLPKIEPGALHQQVIGTFYDWAYDTGAKIGNQFLITKVMDRVMPINGLHRRGADGKYHTGGPWIMCKHTMEHELYGGARWRFGRNSPDYIGYAFVNSNGPWCPWLPNNWAGNSTLQPQFSTLGAKGAEAWNRMRPDKPDFSLATSLLELKDFAPALKERFKDLFRQVRKLPPVERRKVEESFRKKAGDTHLSAQFGWLPLLRDTIDFAEAFEKRHKRVAELIKNEGKPRHRRTEFSGKYDVNDEQTIVEPRSASILQNLAGAVGPTGVTQSYVSGPFTLTKVIRHKRTVRTWAEGQFRYLLPPGPRTDGWKDDLVKKLLGSQITPSTAYNLIPWSWLVDYFVDLGQFMDAVSPGVADKLICDYAYVMSTTEYSTKITEESPWCASKSGGINMVRPSREEKWVVKMRYPASPFGFGLNMSNLTANQVGILGALGLSKI